MILRETLYTIRPFIEDMLEAHYQELGNTKLFDLDMDWDRYEAIEKQGNSLYLVALDQEFKCVGYSLNVISPHLHYKQQLVCYNDLLYTQPGSRSAIVGGRLMLATKDYAAEAGAVCMSWHAKENTALHRILSKRAKLAEVIFHEEL